jgi:hypothetical protein
MARGQRKFNYETKEGYSEANILGTLPLMLEKECKCIESYLKPEHVMFEWGSGGSTLHFPKFVKGYYSVEHFDFWYRLVRNKLRENPEIVKKVKLYHIRNDLPYKYEDDIPIEVFQHYVDAIDLPGLKRFDIIFVDGEHRTRGFCAMKALSYMDKDSIMFIHDYYERPKLKYLEQYFDIIEKIEDGDTLVVMRKK